MWPFSSKYSIESSGLFKGFTDCHSHLLPGVDDGVKTLDETLEILKIYESLGVRSVWLTPHVMEDVSNEPVDLKNHFEDLQKAYTGPIILKLAAENMLDNLFDTRIAEKNVLPIGPNSSHLLVETSYFTPPFEFEKKLENVKKAGFFPVLAHPERYVYMVDQDYEELLAKGIKFQLNIFSLVGAYGDEARDKARHLLSKNAYSVVGTDTHSLRQLKFSIKEKTLKQKDIDQVLEVMERNPLS